MFPPIGSDGELAMASHKTALHSECVSAAMWLEVRIGSGTPVSNGEAMPPGLREAWAGGADQCIEE
jgi:hypothetical protein